MQTGDSVVRDHGRVRRTRSAVARAFGQTGARLCADRRGAAFAPNSPRISGGRATWCSAARTLPTSMRRARRWPRLRCASAAIERAGQRGWRIPLGEDRGRRRWYLGFALLDEPALGRRRRRSARSGHARRGGGRIINLGAGAAGKGGTGMGAYAASKAGVQRFTEALAEELKDRTSRSRDPAGHHRHARVNRVDMPKADFTRWVSPRRSPR